MKNAWRYFSTILAVVAIGLIGCKKTPIHIGLAKYTGSPPNNLMEERIVSIVSKAHPEAVFTQEDAGGVDECVREISTAFANNAELQLRVAIDAPIAQSFAAKPGTPIIYAGVTDPESAGLLNSANKITGYSDAVSIQTAIKYIKILLPKIKVMGHIRLVNESNSQYITSVIRYRSGAAGIHSLVSTIRKVDQIPDAVIGLTSGENKVDALYLANSSYLFENIGTIVEIANRYQVPIISSDPVGSVGTGVMFAYGPDYNKIAEATAHLIIEFLEAKEAGKDDQQQVIFNEKIRLLKGDDSRQIYIDSEVAKKFGVIVPDKILSQAVNSPNNLR